LSKQRDREAPPGIRKRIEAKQKKFAYILCAKKLTDNKKETLKYATKDSE